MKNMPEMSKVRNIFQQKALHHLGDEGFGEGRYWESMNLFTSHKYIISHLWLSPLPPSHVSIWRNIIMSDFSLLFLHFSMTLVPIQTDFSVYTSFSFLFSFLKIPYSNAICTSYYAVFHIHIYILRLVLLLLKKQQQQPANFYCNKYIVS